MQQRCPACGEVADNLVESRIANCASCSHRWQPTTDGQQRTLEKAIYSRGYAGYLPDATLAQSFDDLIENWLSGLVPSNSVILDVGCGAGAFLEAANRAGYGARGIDVSSDAAQLCRERGLDAFSGDFLTWGTEGEFSVITMWDVIEHLREPASFLDRVANLLPVDGIFFAKVPTYGSLSVNLSDHLPRLRQIMLGAPDHVQYFTPHSLRRLMDRSGLKVLQFVELETGLRRQPRGGGFRKLLVRRAKSAIAAASGEGNILIVAKKVA